MQYGFPGNVRELRIIVIRLSTKYPGETLNREQLLGEFDWEEPLSAHTEAGPDKDIKASVKAARKRLHTKTGFLLDQALRDLERSYVEAAPDITRANLSQAAKLLGIHRTTLYSRMQHHTLGMEEGN